MGYFFVAGALGGLKGVSEDVFGHTDSFGRFLKNICRGPKNRLFSQGVSPGFLVKFDQILKSAFFALLCH